MADDISLVVGVDYSDLTGLVKTSEQTKRVLSSAAKDFARTGNQKQYMHAINKIVQAQKQLDVSSRMSRSQLMKLGAEMQQEAKFTDELARATNRLGGAMNTSRNKMNGSNMAIQQLGYQVGDFAVQVQSGTSAFVAFSQQGAQLAGMLPMVAGPLGMSMKMAVGLSAAFGVLIPIGSAVGRMLFEMKNSAKEAAEEAETLDNKLESLGATLEDYANTLDAIRSGVSLDELFASRGVESAADALEEAEDNLNSLYLAASTTPSGNFAGVAFVDWIRQSIAEGKVAEAYDAVLAARSRLAEVERKEDSERFANFSETRSNLLNELELLRAIEQHGAGSAQAKKAELDQELRLRLEGVDAQVEALEITEAQGVALKTQILDAAQLTAQIEASTQAEERRLAAIQDYANYQAQIAQQQAQTQAGVDAIADAMQNQTDRLTDQIALDRLRATFGEDSAQVAEERARQAREAYEQSLMDQGILGNNLKTQMALYDLGVKSANSARDRLELDRQRATAQQQTLSAASQLADQERLLGQQMQQTAKQQKETEVLAGLLRDGISASVVAAVELSETDLSKGISPAVREAAQLATNLGIAYGRAAAIVDMQSTPDMLDEDLAMSGAVVTGSATDRYDRKTLLGMGYTEAYLKSIGMDDGGGGAAPFDQDAYLEALQKEADFKQDLVGMTEEQATEAERRREIMMKIQSEGQVADEARIKTILATEAATRGLIEAEEQRQSTMDMVTGHIESAFMSMVDGSKSVEDAFKGMLRAILLEIYQQQVAKPLAQSIGSFLFPNANGNAFSGGNVIPFANGGVVSSATMFPMAGNQTGVMGEAGPEAIMPLKRGANGKLGVQMEGGGQSVVVNQSFNFSANGDDSVKKIIAQAAPQIANMTKKSIMDDRRRGGQMKATFG